MDRTLLHRICEALRPGWHPQGRLSLAHPDENLPSAFRVTDLAAFSIATAALSLGELIAPDGPAPDIVVDRRLASLWFGMTFRPIGWQAPDPWDSIAGDYRASDGWIRLHTNAPRHRAAALRALGCADERAVVTQAVARWTADDLESAIVEAGGCAAQMRSVAQWRAHPQGQALASEPLVHATRYPASAAGRGLDPARPLAGIKVLDLTRVLAGPVATRFLAGFGAEVLRIDPPGWEEAALAPEVTLGKTCSRLDLENKVDRAVFERLLSQADILVHGYRPAALDGLGYDEARRRALNPRLIDISLCAYGWSGPWQGRRGFDSLVQMSSGIADAGQAWRGADKPVPLPVQAIDHATGYLMAASALQGLRSLAGGEGAMAFRLSLARTADLLLDGGRQEETRFTPAGDGDFAPRQEATSWGGLLRLLPPVAIHGTPLSWKRGASPLGSGEPRWHG